MNYDVQMVPVGKLRPSPRTLATHADFDPNGRDAWLLKDIEKNGVLDPVWVRHDGTLEDGFRRVECAKRAKLDKVPAYIVPDGVEVFDSKQLARNMTLYGKCTLYRAQIKELTQHGDANRVKNPDSSQARDQREREWVQIEEVLGTHRKTLQNGVIVLALIEESRAAGDTAKADKLTTIFRNQGLKPVRRLLGYAVDGSDELAADPGERDYESEEPLPPEPAKKPLKRTDKSHAPTKERRGRRRADSNWRTEWLGGLDQLEQVAIRYGRSTPEIKDWFAAGREFAGTKKNSAHATDAVAQC